MEKPIDKHTTYIHKAGNIDGEGRALFTAYWWGYRADLNTDGVRAQCFHTNLQQFITTEKYRGQKIEFVITKPEA